MNHIEVNGTALRYDLVGDSGPLLVMIHEMGGSLENWDGVLPHFEGDHRCLRYDVRGCGLSEKVRGTLDVDLVTDDLVALLDALGLDEAAILAGCALGAATALTFAARFPERAAAVIVMSPAIDMKPEDRPARRAMLEGVMRDGMRSIADGALAAGYPEVLRARDPERFRAFRARWLGNDPVSFAAQYHLLIDMDLSDRLPLIRCPTLGIGGTLDIFRSPDYVRRVLSPVADVEFVTLETSHHQTVETPDEIAEAIRAFLDRRLARRAA